MYPRLCVLFSQSGSLLGASCRLPCVNAWNAFSMSQTLNGTACGDCTENHVEALTLL